MGRNALSLMVLGLMVVMVFTGGCSASSDPDAERIKSDLIGRDVVFDDGMDSWRFDSLSEFEKFTINNKNRQRDIIEYDISMHLVASTGRCYAVDSQVIVTYRRESDNWKLISLNNKSSNCVRRGSGS